jgi:nitroimidazol reductase NimA-like FMN-containing flavoprotein (pyridoxamine 5'-phosphate oxidase superfamily)
MDLRRQIRMTPDEQEAFLDSARTIVLCSLDREGFPHAVAMWFCRIDGLVHMTTYRKSQKAVNLRRDARATLLVESGARYDELRGLMIRCRAEVLDDPELCLEVLSRIHAKHGGSTGPETLEALRAQAAKRSVLRFHPLRVSSWDHSKLGGAR